MRTLRLAMVGAVILVLLGGLGGIALAQDVDPMRPDVEPMGPLEPDGTSMFTMRQVSVEAIPWPEAVPGPDGVVRWQGPTDAWTIESSDPRLSGTYTLFGNGEAWPLDEENGVYPTVMSGAVRIENDDGTWTGTRLTWMGVDPADYYQVRGEGTYEGLTAVFHWVDLGLDEAIDEAFRIYSGVVIPGPLPDYPELIAE